MPSAYLMPSVSIPSTSECLSVFIPSASESLQLYHSFGLWLVSLTFYPAVSHLEQWLTAHYIPSLIIYDPCLLSLSVAPYSKFPSSFLNWRIMEYISVGGYVYYFFIFYFFLSGGKITCGIPRAAAHLMLWTHGEFLLAVLLTRRCFVSRTHSFRI